MRFTTEIGEAVRGAALVIEAVFEDAAVKHAVFADVAAHVGSRDARRDEHLVVAGHGPREGVSEPGRFAGLHFFYPAAINKLVEVIGGEETAPATRRELERFCYLLKKIPIDTADRAGFCVNRYFVPYLNEATRLAEEGVANLGTIEEVGRELFGATLGPFELMNVTGIPIAFHAETSLYTAFGPAYAPSKLLEQQFRSGQPWAWKESPVEPEKKAVVRARFLGLTIGIATRLVEEGVATRRRPTGARRSGSGERTDRSPF